MNPFSRRLTTDIPMLDAGTLDWLLSYGWHSASRLCDPVLASVPRPWERDLRGLGSLERNSPEAKASKKPSDREGASHWVAEGRVRDEGPETLQQARANFVYPNSSEHPALSNLRNALRPQMELRGNIAIIPIHGVLARRPDPFEQAFLGVEDSTAIYDLVTEAIANPEIHGILLHIDSPGGMHIGGPEIADAIWRSPKPVVAFADGQMASLAYFIGSQADEIVTTSSAAVGSIGSYIAVPDFSRLYEANGVKMNVVRNEAGKFKGIGIKGVAITDEQLTYLQDRAESAFRVFQKAVQRARPSVSQDTMQGQWYSGTEAKKLGLVDRLGDLPFALSVLRTLIRRTG